MRVIFVILLMYVSFAGINGQESKPYGSLANQTSVREELSIANKNGIQNAYAYSKKYAGIQGDPFLTNKWIQGTVCIADSAVVNNEKVKLKFSSYANELWILNGNDSLIAFSKDILWFSLKNAAGNDKFEKYPKLHADPQYFLKTVFKNEDFVLVQDVKKKLTKADYVDRGMYTSGSLYDRFEDDSSYLISYRGSQFAKVKLTVKSFKKTLPKSFGKKTEAHAKRNMIPSKFSEVEACRLLQSLSDVRP